MTSHPSVPLPPPLPLHLELRELAADLARAAGLVAFAGRRSGESLGGVTKTSPTDLVTKFDKEAEATIVSRLRELRPNDAIIGEEGANHPGTSGYAWHIDPIDGTTNFVYDLPGWGVSIGVACEGTAVAGAVFIPALDELFAGALNAGATLNGTPHLSLRSIRSCAVVGIDRVFVSTRNPAGAGQPHRQHDLEHSRHQAARRSIGRLLFRRLWPPRRLLRNEPQIVGHHGGWADRQRSGCCVE